MHGQANIKFSWRDLWFKERLNVVVVLLQTAYFFQYEEVWNFLCDAGSLDSVSVYILCIQIHKQSVSQQAIGDELTKNMLRTAVAL